MRTTQSQYGSQPQQQPYPPPQYPPSQHPSAHGLPPIRAKSKLPLIIGAIVAVVIIVIVILALLVVLKPPVEVKMEFQPSTAQVGETVVFKLIVTNNGGETITVTSVDLQEDVQEKNKHQSSTINEDTVGWKTAAVPPGETVIVYQTTFVTTTDQIGTWTREMTVHTSVGNFYCSTTFTVYQ